MVLEFLSPSETTGELGCVVVGSRAGWRESAFLVHGYFLMEFEPGCGHFRLKLVLEAKTWLAGV